jgi:hypothetical protein
MACVTVVQDGMIVEATQRRLMVKDSVVHLGMPKTHELDLEEAAYRDNGKANETHTRLSLKV